MSAASNLSRLSRLIQPQSVAIVGLSADPQKHGARVLTNLRRFGFQGSVWGVNPRASELHGIPTYASLREVPEPPDAVVLAIPASATLEAIQTAADIGVGGAVLFGGGFAETGAEGRDLQRHLSEVALAGEVRLLGPNSAGIVNTSDGVVMSFLTCLERPPEQLRPGPVGLVTQSGGTASYIHNLAAERGTGTAVTISTGNEADIKAGEALRYLLERPDVSAVALLLETVRDGPAFIAAGQRALELGKPIVVCKIGRSPTGERAMRTHTAALAGTQRRFDAVFDALGMTVTGTPEELFDVAELMARSPRAEGSRVGIVTHSGGTAVLLADEMERCGVSMPRPSPQLQKRLAPYLQLGAAGNPTDLGGIITEPQRYADVVRLFLEDPGFDIVVAASTPHPPRHTPDRARRLADLVARSPNPLLNLWLAGDIGAEGLQILRAAHTPVTTSVDSTARAVAGLARFAELCQGAAIAVQRPDPAVLQGLADLQRRGRNLDEEQSKSVLGTLGLPVLRHRLAPTPAEAATLAAEIGFPVVVKVVAPQVVHKTELGAVRLNLQDATAVQAACEDMSAAVRQDPSMTIRGFLVEEYAPGLEMILGIAKDSTFGPMVLVGAGGVYAEALDDVSLGVAPLSGDQALRLIQSLKGYRLLRGLRGSPVADEEALARLLAELSQVAVAYAGVIDEVDVNPLIFSGGRWYAADALVRLAPASPGTRPGSSRAAGLVSP